MEKMSYYIAVKKRAPKVLGWLIVFSVMFLVTYAAITWGFVG